MKVAYAAGCHQEDCDDDQCNGNGGGRGKASPHDGNAPCNHCHHVQKLLEKSPDVNFQCHCQHVETLMRDVRSFTTRVNQHEGSLDTLLKRVPGRYDGSGADPGAGGYGGHGGAGGHGGPGGAGGHGGPGGGGGYDPHAAGALGWPLGAAPARLSLPLALGPLGALATGRAFDDRVSIQDEFKFNGAKGDVWKGKIERYFFSRVPAVYELFSWAEREEGPITDDRLREAVGDGLTTTDRDGNATDHTQALNCAIL